MGDLGTWSLMMKIIEKTSRDACSFLCHLCSRIGRHTLSLNLTRVFQLHTHPVRDLFILRDLIIASAWTLSPR
jgi:hypothetical protein